MKRLNPFMVYSAGWGGMVAGVILYLILSHIVGVQPLHEFSKAIGTLIAVFGCWLWAVNNSTESMD